MTCPHEADGRPAVDEQKPNLSDLAEGKKFIVMDDGSRVTPTFYRRALSFQGEKDWFAAAKTLEAHEGQDTDLDSHKLRLSCKNNMLIEELERQIKEWSARFKLNINADVQDLREASEHDLPWVELVPARFSCHTPTRETEVAELAANLHIHGISRQAELIQKFCFPIKMQLVYCKALLFKIKHYEEDYVDFCKQEKQKDAESMEKPQAEISKKIRIRFVKFGDALLATVAATDALRTGLRRELNTYSVPVDMTILKARSKLLVGTTGDERPAKKGVEVMMRYLSAFYRSKLKVWSPLIAQWIIQLYKLEKQLLAPEIMEIYESVIERILSSITAAPA
ncbi:hypothetical protein M7I_0225 [Glarea lozoyensis 74030]|nr:hypothetical protein M7I_0225 [Glarea lozoyensis 74030]